MKLTRTHLVRILPLAALAILFLAPGTALAHEQRTIANGKYDVAVGWDVEPAYVDLKNGAGIRIMNAGTTTPVDGADKTLKLPIRQGASTRDFPLRAVFGQAGYYVADLMPTREGDYQWIFTGNINGDQVNETFDTADGKFDRSRRKQRCSSRLPWPTRPRAPARSRPPRQTPRARARWRMSASAIGVLGVLAGVGAWLSRAARSRRPRRSADRRASASRLRDARSHRGPSRLRSLLAALLLPATASAHANLDRAEPAPGSQLDQPPHQLQLFFSEAVDGSFSRVQLLNAQRDAGRPRRQPCRPERSAFAGRLAARSAAQRRVHRRLADAVGRRRAHRRRRLSVDRRTHAGRRRGGRDRQLVFASPVRARNGDQPLVVLDRRQRRVRNAAELDAGLQAAVRSQPTRPRCRWPRRAARRLAVGSAVLLLIGTLYGALAQAAAAAEVPLWACLGQPLVDLLSHGPIRRAVVDAAGAGGRRARRW